jgi:hypothetical protein
VQLAQFVEGENNSFGGVKDMKTVIDLAFSPQAHH